MAITTRKRYSKGKRVDMRQGGRVRLHVGGGQTHQYMVDPDSGEEYWFDPTTQERTHDPATHSGNGGNGGNGSSTSSNPFPDSGNIPYAATTEEQAELARKQVADAAAGQQVSGKSWIPTPAKLAGKWDFSKDWQEGGNIGTHLKTEGGQTGQELFKALYAAGSEGTPADWITIGGKQYGWDDYHDLINKEKGMHDTIKTDSIYEADVTTMGEDTSKAAAGDVGTTPTEVVSTQTSAAPAQKQTAKAITEAGIERVADKTPDVKVAKGTVTRTAVADEIRQLTEKAVAAGLPSDAALEKAKADFVAGSLSVDAMAQKQTGVGSQMSDTPQAESKSREAITGTAPQGDASQIGGVPTLQTASRQAITGTARTRAAIDMIAETGDLPPQVAQAIIEDPETVAAQIDNEDVSIQAAVAALPTEALVSSQMETLLAGIEEGETPVWARPAVARVQEMMAERGLDVSTVARDSLFNAIIQTALPMAQSNAQALQQRATQNLTFQQQATITVAQQDMQRRMTNVANSQTAASQTAQMAQQVAIQQGTFGQQAGVRTAELQQQTRMQNLQNEQEAARLTAQQAQQAQLANLSNEQQMEALNLQVEAERLGTEFTAEQQTRLAKFQTSADFMAKNAAFTQDMEKANLSSLEKLELANLAAKNQAAAETMSSEEKIELANLESKLRVGVTNANLANAMGIAQLNSDQTIAMQNAQVQAGMDMANFSTEQQMELANSKFLQSITIQDFNQKQQAAMQNASAMASLDMATVDQRTKLSITNAQNFLQMDMANLNNTQQSYVMDAQMRQQALLSDQAAFNASEQFNAASQNQLDQYMTGLSQQIELTNVQRNDAMQQFNATQNNAAEARRAGNEQQARLLTAQLTTDVNKFNDAQDYNREIFNAQQANAIEQFNVSWRRDANKIDTAAVNAVNQQNAQNAFGLSTQAMGFMWQELRDQMDYSFKTYDNDQQRKASLIVAALGNEQAADTDGWSENWTGFSTLITNYVTD